MAKRHLNQKNRGAHSFPQLVKVGCRGVSRTSRGPQTIPLKDVCGGKERFNAIQARTSERVPFGRLLRGENADRRPAYLFGNFPPLYAICFWAPARVTAAGQPVSVSQIIT